MKRSPNVTQEIFRRSKVRLTDYYHNKMWYNCSNAYVQVRFNNYETVFFFICFVSASFICPGLYFMCPCKSILMVRRFHHHHDCEVIVSHGRVKASAISVRVCLPCAILCHMVPFQYSHCSSLHLLADLSLDHFPS